MRSIVVFNNKGGVGKTTLLCNLASYLALRKGLKVAVVDADPQCNATQALFSDEVIDRLYLVESSSPSTVADAIRPVVAGEGGPLRVPLLRSPGYGVDVLPGDPYLARQEDDLAGAWAKLENKRRAGFNVTFFFRRLLDEQLQEYDLVFFDVGPSLGSINRSVLVASQYFISPMSIDIFSLRALDNIAQSLEDWKSGLETSVANADKTEIPDAFDVDWKLRFLGYVTQQYTFRRDGEGRPRGVAAYSKIESSMPAKVEETLFKSSVSGAEAADMKLGTIPNLHSLVPMSQTARKPIFELGAHDGVVGAHFSKVREFEGTIAMVAENLLRNLNQGELGDSK